MRDRHRWLLLFLGADGGKYDIDQVRAMKGLFLLSKEDIHPEAEFYSFDPYDYGPFDSRVYRDLDILEAEGLVDASTHWGSNKRTYHLTDEGLREYEKVLTETPVEKAASVNKVKQRVTSLGFDELLEQIYTEYPEYQGRSVSRVAKRLTSSF